MNRHAVQAQALSTEHQRYSTANLRNALARYAKEHGLEIVRTYTDEGRSGLDIQGRPALRSLLQDVAGGAAGFGVVLPVPGSYLGVNACPRSSGEDCELSQTFPFSGGFPAPEVG